VRIRWQDDAIEDLKKIRRYIAMDNPVAAQMVAAQIRDAVPRLIEHPAMGRAGRIPGTRELVLPDLPYIVPYRVEEQSVVILRVLHTARRWPEYLGTDPGCSSG
jgi:toxin ParE1/3/4